MKKVEAAKVASPYGHGIDRVLRAVDTLAVMTRRGQLTDAQYHAGQRYRHCYDVIYGQMGGASDFERTRGKGLPGSPPSFSYLQASEIVSQVKRILYPRDYAVVHRVCVEGYRLGNAPRNSMGRMSGRNERKPGVGLKKGCANSLKNGSRIASGVFALLSASARP